MVNTTMFLIQLKISISLMIFLLLKQKRKTTNKTILNLVENFDKPNESAHFEVEKVPIN